MPLEDHRPEDIAKDSKVTFVGQEISRSVTLLQKQPNCVARSPISRKYSASKFRFD